MKKLLVSLLLLLSLSPIVAQSTFIPYNRDYYHLIDRFQIKYSSAENILPTTFKPLRRSDLSDFLLSIQDKYDSFSTEDQFNFEFLMNDNWEWTNSPYNENAKNWWNLAYERKSDFFTYELPNLSLRINPVFHFELGQGQNEPQSLFTNTRGFEAQGIIDDKIGFYTFVSTTQSILPTYVRNVTFPRGSLPYESSWKRFGDNGYDYFHVRGYFNFNLTKSIDVQAGYDKNFIGNGLRSMIMSDYSSPYLFGKINTRVGRIQYTNLFTQMTADIQYGQGFPGEGDYPKKFLVMHRLGLDITPKLNIGISEFIVSENSRIEYFNPIIFLRSLELANGSPGNVLISFDANYVFRNQLRFYGQFFFDDFEISALRNPNDPWEVKFGVQLGAKYIDAFNINTFDLQLETNISRPYFYAHEFLKTSFINNRNPLAHPLGANFKEIILAGSYQPIPRLTIQGKLINANYGEDRDGLNFGGNPLLDTDDRISQNGIVIGQGEATTLNYLELTGSYILMHNVFVDLKNIYRDLKSENPANSSSAFFTQVALRWNLPQRHHEF